MIYGQEHLSLMETVKRFCEAEINPAAAEWERAGVFPAHDLFAKLGALGLLGITKPTEFGGLGLDYTYQLAFAEALGASRCASINLAVGVQTDMATPALARFGSETLKAEFLKGSISGDLVACLGVSEVDAGSDISSISTTARRIGDDYVINGGKMWTTNGTQADWICLLCRTSDGESLFNKSLICVPMKTVGVKVVRRLEKLGMNASDTAQIFFEDVRVPVANRIGHEGRGLLYQMDAFLEERLYISACGLLSMDRMLIETIEYARVRRTFGKALLENQAVQFRLAELKAKVEALRSLVYRACDAYVRGAPETAMLVSMAKLTAGRLQRELCDSCLQYFGAAGYLSESEVARMFRDSRLTSIGGGTDEVMLMMISRYMGMSGQLSVGG